MNSPVSRKGWRHCKGEQKAKEAGNCLKTQHRCCFPRARVGGPVIFRTLSSARNCWHGWELKVVAAWHHQGVPGSQRTGTRTPPPLIQPLSRPHCWPSVGVLCVSPAAAEETSLPKPPLLPWHPCLARSGSCTLGLPSCVSPARSGLLSKDNALPYSFSLENMRLTCSDYKGSKTTMKSSSLLRKAWADCLTNAAPRNSLLKQYAAAEENR